MDSNTCKTYKTSYLTTHENASNAYLASFCRQIGLEKKGPSGVPCLEDSTMQ